MFHFRQPLGVHMLALVFKTTRLTRSSSCGIYELAMNVPKVGQKVSISALFLLPKRSRFPVAVCLFEHGRVVVSRNPHSKKKKKKKIRKKRGRKKERKKLGQRDEGENDSTFHRRRGKETSAAVRRLINNTRYESNEASSEPCNWLEIQRSWPQR